MRWSVPLRALALLLLLPALAAAAIDPETAGYLKGLGEAGYADLAVEWIERRLGQEGLSPELAADLEFERAASMVLAADTLADLSRRDQMLRSARERFGELVRKHPDHPRSAESHEQSGGIDLVQGRLRILEAQLPANADRAETLAEEAREYLRAAVLSYAKARDRYLADYKRFPVFIPDERPEDRDLRRDRDAAFRRYIEARFQAAVAQYHLADSYRSIEPARPTGGGDEAMRAYEKKQADGARAGKEALEEAAKQFEQLSTEHRREGIGLYAQLWLARCMASKGEARRARGVLDLLTKHENRDLAAFQREVFQLSLSLSLADKDYEGVIARGSDWLRENGRFLREPAALGVMMDMARAQVALANAADDNRERDRRLVEANRLYERVASFPNLYTGLARREQLALASATGKGPTVRGFQQAASLASAKLDAIPADAKGADLLARLEEVIGLYRTALAPVSPADADAAVLEARLSLAYALLRAEHNEAAAVLAEFVAREFPKSAAAAPAGQLAATAYAWAFEKAAPADGGAVEARRLAQLVAYLGKGWPKAKETDEARLTLARVAFARGELAAAAAAAESVPQDSPRWPEAAALAGNAYWSDYKAQARREKPDPATLADLRQKAIERLQASVKTPDKPGPMPRSTLLPRVLLAEAWIDAGEPKEALATLAPAVDAIQKNERSPGVEPALWTAAAVTALEAAIRAADVNSADRLIAVVSSLPASENASGATAVLVQLAARLKEQVERLAASGREKERAEMVAAFERFLDRVSRREEGQTLESLVYLADNFLELGKPDRAAPLLERALAQADAASESKRPVVQRARLLLVRAQRSSGDVASARTAIDPLLRENLSARDVIVERGAVLEAAGDWNEAIKHWKWYLKMLTPSRPRPPEFYETVGRLLAALDKVQGPDRPKRLAEGLGYARFLLTSDPALPAEWRVAFEERGGAMARELGQPPPGGAAAAKGEGSKP